MIFSYIFMMFANSYVQYITKHTCPQKRAHYPSESQLPHGATCQGRAGQLFSKAQPMKLLLKESPHPSSDTAILLCLSPLAQAHEAEPR